MGLIKKTNTLVNIFIILVAVSPAFALGDGNRNLLLIGAMCLSPYFLIRYPMIIPKVDIPLVALCGMMMVFPLQFHPETMRWSTVLYGCLFCLFFMAFVRVLIRSSYTIEDFKKLLKGLIYAYCIVLMIQQFCVLTGLPIFNVSNYAPSEPWKLNSLMSEPSHSARIIPVLMYLFTSCQRIIDKAQSIKESFLSDRWVWLAFLWTLLTMVSATAFIFLFIIVLQFVNVKKMFSTILLVASVVLSFTLASENESIQRVRRVVAATVTLNEAAIIEADHSASFRIVPTIQGAKFVGVSTLNDWVGNGVDADQRLMDPLSSVLWGSAGAFYLWVNFGLIVAILWWCFSFRTCFIRKNMVSVLVWFLCIWMYGGLNNQIVWLAMALLFTYKRLNKSRLIEE